MNKSVYEENKETSSVDYDADDEIMPLLIELGSQEKSKELL